VQAYGKSRELFGSLGAVEARLRLFRELRKSVPNGLALQKIEWAITGQDHLEPAVPPSLETKGSQPRLKQEASHMNGPTVRLDGIDSGRLARLLFDAFLPERFEELLLYRLNKPIHSCTSKNDDHPTVLRKVIAAANADLWWRDLLRETRNANPADPGLSEFAERYDLSPRLVSSNVRGTQMLSGSSLELKIKESQSTFDIVTWRRKLGEIEGRVCRIEVPEKAARGTGFLVGPDLVMTNFHVIEGIYTGRIPSDRLVVRFDYKVLNDGVTVFVGKTYQLAKEWLVDFSPYSARDHEILRTADPSPDELDYALLRLESPAGEDPVGGDTADPRPTPRKWIQVPLVNHDFSTQHALYIVQHPDGQPMQVAIDSDAVLGVNPNGTRVRYTTTTQPGSSGSPCFDSDWECVALHHSGDPKYWRGEKPEFNEGIPLATIRRLLEQKGKSQLLGG